MTNTKQIEIGRQIVATNNNIVTNVKQIAIKKTNSCHYCNHMPMVGDILQGKRERKP